MRFLFESPSVEDMTRLLHAWRIWVLGAVIGAIIGAVVYYAAPPPYRARATVNVDFNLEQAWPEDTDRQQFYYLEREARKIEEIAWHDEIMRQLSSQFSVSVEELRGGKLLLTQPAEAGWHFYADDYNAQVAEMLASAWAENFVRKIQDEVRAGNINEFIELEVTQSANLPKERSIPLSEYLLAGAFGFLALIVFLVLFVRLKD